MPPKVPKPDWFEMNADALLLGMTLEKVVENAHPNASGDELANYKMMMRNGNPDGPTRMYLQQQLQRQTPST